MHQRKKIVCILLAAGSIAANVRTQVKYPVTKKINQTGGYFGTKMQSPNHWPEDDGSEDTRTWVDEQNMVTNNYLLKIPYREQVKKAGEKVELRPLHFITSKKYK